MNTIYFGIIEDRDDPLKLGRCKVRIVGLHTHDSLVLPTRDLPWAMVAQPVSGGSNAASMAPTNGTEVMVVFADEPDCQIPIVVGIIPTLPQAKHVWLDCVPTAPKVKDVNSYDVGHSLPRSQTEEARSKSEEIGNGQRSQIDDNTARDVAANADSSKQDSVKALSGIEANPTTSGQSSLAAQSRNTLGKTNPTNNQKLLATEIAMGSESKALTVHAEKLIKEKGLTLAKQVLNGEKTIAEAMGEMSGHVADGVDALGQEKFDSIFGDAYGKLKEDGGKAFGGISGMAGSLGDLSNAFEGGLSVDNIGAGLGAVEGALDGLLELEEGLGGLCGTISGMFDDEKDLADSAEKAVEESTTQEALLTMADKVLEMDLSGIGGPVGEVLATMRKCGIDTTNIKSIVKSFTGAGGLSFKLQFDASGLADTFTRKIRDLLAVGVDTMAMIRDTCGKMKGYSGTIERILTKAAKASFLTGIDGKAIAAAVYNFFNFIEVTLDQMISLVKQGEKMVVDWVTKKINSMAASFLDVFNGLEDLIEEILNLIPFMNIIVNMIMNYVSSFLPGNDDNKIDFGIGPVEVAAAVDCGTYTSNAFNGVGNRSGIDKQGKGNVNDGTFANVGEGNTPPIHGRLGGPNFGGAKSKPEQGTPVSLTDNPSSFNRALNLDQVPNIPGVQPHERSHAMILSIAEMAPKLGLGTPEAICALLAVSYAYCRCVPQVRSYEYTDRVVLLQKFPRTFGKATEEIVRNHLFAESQKKCTAKEFYNYVYDSATDGQALGNAAADDGYRYAEAGLLPLIGKIGYQTYGIESASKLCESLETAVRVANSQMMKVLAGIPAGDMNAVIVVTSTAFGIDKDVAIKAYEHFYGAKTYDSYKVNDKVAGNAVDANGYYGSAQEQQPMTGFQDPNGKYPYNRNANTSTISKLATGEKVNTIVTSKESNRHLAIPLPMKQGTWDQPHSSYAAKYPYNTVRETESGHIQEFDDTPGHERIHVYHRKGTFEEIDENGTKVTRIVGDGYTLIDRNGFIFVAGNANITCNGNINIYCQTHVNLEAKGTIDMVAHGGMNLSAAQDINISAGGNLNMWSGESANLQCKKNMNIRSEGSMLLTSKKELSSTAKKRVYVSSFEEDVKIRASGSVGVEAEKNDIELKAGHYVNVDAKQTLNLKAGANAVLSGGSDVDINSGANLRQQANVNMTVLCGGWFRRTVGIATDISSGGYLHMSAAGSTQISSIGELSIATQGLLSLGALGLININAGAELRMGAVGLLSIMTEGALSLNAGAAASLTGVGKVGINGAIVGLNSGLTVPPTKPLPVVTKPALSAGIAMKASGSCGSVVGPTAVPYGMIAIAPEAPLCPCISPLLSLHPFDVGEAVIEDESQLQFDDAKLIAQDMATSTKRTRPFEGPTITEVVDPNIEHKVPIKLDVLNSNLGYNANTKISEHFKLDDLFDGGYNRKHILQDQAGLTREQIVNNLCNLAENVLEPLLEILPGGIDGYRKQWRINSGYRATKNNANTNGASKTSQHCKGQAVDIQLIGKSKADHFYLIKKVAENLRFDQLILEYSASGQSAWIHCSYDEKRARRQMLTINLCMPKGQQTKPGFIQYA